ncbi:ring-cleaving dioxygenase [Rubrobacter aplysinae]|uniref:ring-cleaving dioxygenase n=1 Tax=Rubrobacter aplysinae TaxID=909625 RepID=UPI00064C095F
MTQRPQGLHHVTAIAGNPQRNLDFYEGVLGLRLVKKTVNFDDPTTYHLYYGDAAGNPGTIMTFFPWASPGAPLGKRGHGQLTVTSFAVPEGSLDYWENRFAERGVDTNSPGTRFGSPVLEIQDPDGFKLELVASRGGAGDGGPAVGGEVWEDSPVPEEYAISSFDGVTLSERDGGRTISVLTDVLGFRETGEDDGRTRLEAGDGGPGNRVDILEDPREPTGSMGVGTVHHVAFRVPDEEGHRELREELAALGYGVTPVIDRQYFKAIYFREPGGVLFEIATDPPGFATDENLSELGTNLKLPPQHEPRRAELQSHLPALETPAEVRNG